MYDGHGRDGDKCAQFSSDHLPNLLARHIKKVKKSIAEQGEPPEDVELNKEKTQAAINLAHKQCNRAMHASREFEDALSGTTAISTYFQGRRNRVTISNVGDSRAVLGQRITRENGGVGGEDSYRALPLSRDQTPYRSGERKRIRACGARILSLDQIEGVEPVNDMDDDTYTDFELGEEIDEGGDPPRVWHPTLDYPGTAFTRSLGDQLAEELGVIADPEMVTRELVEGDEIIVLASDGVFEFLTNQSVIDICAKFRQDPLEACRAVIAQSYELWLQYELRTDDITMICIFIDGIDDNSANMFKSTKNGLALPENDKPDELKDDGSRATLANSFSGKMSKRFVEIKSLLEESLMDIPSPEEGFDLDKYRTEKAEEDKECIRIASRASVMLQSMSETQLEQMFGVMQPLLVQKGDWVIRQGAEGDRFYIVGTSFEKPLCYLHFLRSLSHLIYFFTYLHNYHGRGWRF